MDGAPPGRSYAYNAGSSLDKDRGRPMKRSGQTTRNSLRYVIWKFTTDAEVGQRAESTLEAWEDRWMNLPMGWPDPDGLLGRKKSPANS